MKNKRKFISALLMIIVLLYTFPVFSLEIIENQNNEQQEIEKEEKKNEIEPAQKEDKAENQNNEPEIKKSEIQNNAISISYQTHVQDIGWQDYVKDGETSGTSHQSKRLEAIKIKIDNTSYSGDIQYSTHVQDIGWQDYVKNNELSGTSHQSKRLEAIKIKLTGDLANHYDVYYRVHAQEFGWLDWAKNDEAAGSSGYSYRLEAIEIKLVEKNTSIYFKTDCAFRKAQIFYETHVESIGWQGIVYDGNISGTSGRSLRLEAIKIALRHPEYEGSIEYKSYVENIGWQDYVKNGEIAGTSGQSLRLEAVKIRLTGEMAEHYDVYYRVHAQEFGWLDWAKNGESAGTSGYAYRLEAIEIKLINKGAEPPGKTIRSYINRLIKYSGYQKNRWIDTQYDGEVLGTIGTPLNSFLANIIKSDYSGTISYASYVTGLGWQKTVKGNTNSNPETKKMEAIRMNLSGEISNYYDIYYSVYISNIGWSGWGKNNEICGNVGFENYIQALKIKLVEKNEAPPGTCDNIYQEDDLHIKYQSYVQENNWQNYVQDGATSGTTGQSKSIQGIKIRLNKKTIDGNIEYSTHVSDVGWQKFFKEEEQGGLIGKKIEAIKIRLTGNLAKKYNIYYRVHVATVGWMGWTSNGENAGTSKAGLGVEAIEIKLIEKGQNAPHNTNNAKTTEPYLEGRWTTDVSGNRYYYDVFGNMIKGRMYKIGNATYYFSPTGILIGNEELEVIDVSAHNGSIDWKSVAESGIYGAILRISASAIYEDKKLAENIAGVKKYNIPYGIYIYSYAENYSEGIAYANFTKQMMNKYNMNPTLGIFLDLESNNITQFMGTTEYTAVVKGYLSVIPNAELYTYVSYANTALNTSYMRDRITWIAHYNSYCGYTGNYKMWQYTSSGYVSGISGVVDKSKLYR